MDVDERWQLSDRVGLEVSVVADPQRICIHIGTHHFTPETLIPWLIVQVYFIFYHF